MATYYYAVQGQDYDTCEELRWAWMSVRPMVLAEGEEEESVREAAVRTAGHEDIRLHVVDA